MIVSTKGLCRAYNTLLLPLALAMELSKSKTIKLLGDKDVKNKMDRVMNKQECDSLTFSRPYWRTLAIGHFCRDLAFKKLKVLSSKGES